MMNFRVTAEHAPLRCDICHQADCFDAATGVCARCVGVSLPASKAQSEEANAKRRLQVGWLFPVLLGLSILFAGFVPLNGGVYSQLKAYFFPQKYGSELADVEIPDDEVPFRPILVKEESEKIRGWNLLNGRFGPFLNKRGIGYPLTRWVIGRVISVQTEGQNNEITIIVEEGAGKTVSIEIPNSNQMDPRARPMLLEALAPGRFIWANCFVILRFMCGNMTEDESQRAFDRWERGERSQDHSIFADSFESTTFDVPASEKKKVNPRPAMPPPDRTGLHPIFPDNTGAYTSLCNGYDDFPTRNFSGVILTSTEREKGRHDRVMVLKTESGRRVKICTDLRGTSATAVDWVKLDSWMAAGNRVEVTTRAVYGDVFVVERLLKKD